jgi:hypothetical protein
MKQKIAKKTVLSGLLVLIAAALSGGSALGQYPAPGLPQNSGSYSPQNPGPPSRIRNIRRPHRIQPIGRRTSSTPNRVHPTPANRPFVWRRFFRSMATPTPWTRR